MPNKWCPFARRVDGPVWKVGYSYQGEQSPKRGVVPHSAEGYLPGLMSALNGPKAKSWQFSILYDEILQHYPVSANCWHAGDVDDDGGVAANIDLVGIEHLGMADDPLMVFQVNALVRLYAWLQKEHGFGAYALRDTVWEHKWVSDDPTSCPSYRIPHTTIARLLQEGEEHMPTTEYDELKAALEATNALLVIIAGRLEDIRKGDVNVPIWPVGDVNLSVVRHRGYHAHG